EKTPREQARQYMEVVREAEGVHSLLMDETSSHRSIEDLTKMLLARIHSLKDKMSATHANSSFRERIVSERIGNTEVEAAARLAASRIFDTVSFSGDVTDPRDMDEKRLQEMQYHRKKVDKNQDGREP